MRGRCITGAGRCSSHSTGNEHHLKGRGNAALRPNPGNERTENRPIQGRGGTSSSHRATRPGRTTHGGGASRTSPFRSEQSRRSPHRTNEPPNSASDIRTVSCPPASGRKVSEAVPPETKSNGGKVPPGPTVLPLAGGRFLRTPKAGGGRRERSPRAGRAIASSETRL
jgi:hypothetical protein